VLIPLPTGTSMAGFGLLGMFGMGAIRRRRANPNRQSMSYPQWAATAGPFVFGRGSWRSGGFGRRKSQKRAGRVLACGFCNPGLNSADSPRQSPCVTVPVDALGLRVNVLGGQILFANFHVLRRICVLLARVRRLGTCTRLGGQRQ
jgi:hypothetical protein